MNFAQRQHWALTGLTAQAEVIVACFLCCVIYLDLTSSVGVKTPYNRARVGRKVEVRSWWYNCVSLSVPCALWFKHSVTKVLFGGEDKSQKEKIQDAFPLWTLTLTVWTYCLNSEETWLRKLALNSTMIFLPGKISMELHNVWKTLHGCPDSGAMFIHSRK